MTASDGPAPHDGFRPDIEGMRGLAVVLVVIFHAGLTGLAGLGGGFIGVDVFFIISGFLITGLLIRERERTGRIGLLPFYARRARRLLPAALVVLVATLAVALQVVAPLDQPAIGLDAAAAALSVGNIRFAAVAGDYFTTLATPSPFLHYWSLAVEEQFYLVWPALILLVARGVHVRRSVAIALIAVIAASFAANLVITDAAANWAFYSLPTRAWELGLGGLLAVGGGVLARIPDRLVGLAGWLGLAAIGVATVAFDAGLAYPGVAALVPCLGAVALIAGGPRRLGPGRLLSIRPMRFLGKISYSLYLVHWPILVLAPLVIGSEPDDAARIGLICLSVLAAIASWALIETPFRTGLPRLGLRPGRTVSLGMSAILVVVALAVGPSFGLAQVADAVAAGPTGAVASDPPDEPWVDETAIPAAPTTPAATPTGPLPASQAPVATPGSSTAAGAAATVPARDIANEGALPAGVKPALENARTDEERLRADDCLAYEPATKPATCVYGAKKATFIVALVGDSHAAQWFPAVERLANHEGWQVITFVKVACPFIDMRVTNLALKREYRECAAFNEATIARLRALKPDLTLVSMSRIAIHPLEGKDDTVAAKGAAVGRMVARIPGRVAIIVDTPYARRDVPACLSSHKDDIDACAISRKVAMSDHLGDLEAVAVKATGAGLIDLTPRICIGDGPCSVVVNKMIVFRDPGHLTATFSRSLAPALGVEVARVLGS